jgi:hypothetical protein
MSHPFQQSNFIIFIGRSKYYAAKIAAVCLNDTYDLDYDDGEKEFGIDRALIRLQTDKGPGQPLAVGVAVTVVYKAGDRVEGDFKDKGVWYPGVISCDRDDGTYNIEYDDNSIFKEYKVPPTRIRRVRQSITIAINHMHTRTHSRIHMHLPM